MSRFYIFILNKFSFVIALALSNNIIYDLIDGNKFYMRKVRNLRLVSVPQLFIIIYAQDQHQLARYGVS